MGDVEDARPAPSQAARSRSGGPTARAGLAALAAPDDSLPRSRAVASHLHERAGGVATAVRLYSDAARRAGNAAERDHLVRQAARLHAAAGG